MATKELQTRIALKYDSYENWLNTDEAGKGGNLVLLPGELGICEIPGTVKSFEENGKTVTVETAPTVLFKVGGAKNDDGSLKAFKDLPWASAKAADVYNWAKASEVKRVGKELVFVGGNADGTDKKIAFDYVTEDEVKAITEPIAEDLAELSGVVDGIKQSLETLMGAETGSVSDAIAAAEGRAAADATEKANAAETNAKTYAKGLDDATNLRVDEVATDVRENAEAIAANTTAIGAEETRALAQEAAIRDEFAAADLAINNKIGTSADDKDTATVYGAIAKAKADAADDASAKVAALTAEGGAVKANADAIAENAEDIAKLVEDLGTEASERKAADEALDGRLERVEAFFAKKKDDEGNDIALDEALDTLVEIQEYITGDGAAAKDMLDAIEANADAIDEINDIVGAEGTLTKAVAKNTEDITEVAGRVDELETLTAGFGEGETVLGKINAAAELAQTGVNDAATAKAAADDAQADATDAQNRVGVVEGVLNGDDGLVVAVAKNTEDIADVAGRMETAEGEIDALQELSGANAEAIEALEALTAGFDGTIKAAVDAAQDAADNAQDAADAAQEAADAAQETADDNAEAIAAIQADYVSVKADANDKLGLYFGEDIIIFNCGSASDVI